MTLCPYCGRPVIGAAELCGYHSLPDRADWASRNRIMCDLIHRGIAPPRSGASDGDALDTLFDSLDTLLVA
jgi:hypothetical protein